MQWPPCASGSARSVRGRLAALFAVFLAGCGSLTPGFYMGPVVLPSEPEAPDAQVEVIPVTWELLRQLDGTPKGAPTVPALSVRPYKIGAGDSLRIHVFGQSEFSFGANQPGATSANVTVSGRIVADDGTVFVPLVGKIEAAGSSVEQFRVRLTHALEPLVRNPQVEVDIVAYRSQRVFLAGEVAAPGLQPITDRPLYVADAIGKAGGFTANADLSGAILARAGRSYAIDLDRLYYGGDVSQNVRLADGDVLTVPDRQARKLFVLGEVLSPRSYVMRRGRMSLAEALADAGGPNPFASNTGQLFVIRANADGMPQVYVFDSRTPVAMVMAEHFSVAPRDVIYLDPTGLARAGRLVGQLTPFLQTAITTRLLTNP